MHNQITIKADDENNADLFWVNLDKAMPEIADQLRSGEVEVNAETWEEIQKIEGFADGPSYAPQALFEVEK
jgi:hypothetical protein